MNRYYKSALLTSPIIAMYGVSPLYIFDKLTFSQSSILVIGLSANVFVFWLINIYLYKKYAHWNTAKLYFVSFFLVFLTHIPKIWIEPKLPFDNIIDRYLIYPFITTVAINTIILVIMNSIVREQKRREAEAQYEQLKIKNLEAQKQLLVQQLQPHFLFNSLSILKSLISENPGQAENYTLKLSDFLRYTTNINNNDIITVAQEMKFTQDYITLQEYRFGNAITFTSTLSDSIIDKKIPVLALQTLVENAIKHNYFTEKNPLYITIHNEAHRITVANNITTPRLTERSGFGLQNLNKRFQLITGNEIEIEQTDTQFSVILTLTEG